MLRDELDRLEKIIREDDNFIDYSGEEIGQVLALFLQVSAKSATKNITSIMII